MLLWIICYMACWISCYIACFLTSFIKDEEEISACTIMLDILLVCERLLEEKTYVFFFIRIFNLHYTDTTRTRQRYRTIPRQRFPSLLSGGLDINWGSTDEEELWNYLKPFALRLHNPSRKREIFSSYCVTEITCTPLKVAIASLMLIKGTWSFYQN